MELNNLIRSVSRHEIDKTTMLKHEEGIVKSIDGDKITILLSLLPSKPTITVKNRSSFVIEENDRVWIYYWKDISDGFIGMNLTKTRVNGGVGKWTDNTKTNEIFNDYTGNIINNSGNAKFNKYNTVVGSQNEMDSCNSNRYCSSSLLGGNYNYIFNAKNSIVFGNYIRMPSTLNSNYELDCNAIFGKTHEFNSNLNGNPDMLILKYALIGGQGNKLNYSSYYDFVCGIHNTLINTQSCCVAGSYNKVIDGDSSVALGMNNEIQGATSVALGHGNKVNGYYNCAIGTSNIIDTSISQQLVIGYELLSTGDDLYNGTIFLGSGNNPVSPTYSSLQLQVGNGGSIYRQNALTLTRDGNLYLYGSYNSNGADYAEYWEWQDGNVNDEDRRGLFVTLDGDKIRKATADDDLLGIVSSNPSIVGNTQAEDWQGKYKTDIFGDKIYVDVQESITEMQEENGKTIEVETGEYRTVKRPVLSDDYDVDTEYISRIKRKEWSAIGHLGQLVMCDDGTCQVNKYCKSSDGGIATHSDSQTKARVMKRIDDNHILVAYNL